MKNQTGRIDLKSFLPAIPGVVVCAIFARLLLTLLPSYEIDMRGYQAWSAYMAEYGFSRVYDTFHIVYAPAYMYLLWFTGKIAKIFSLGYGTHVFLIKFWSVASDIIGGLLIFLIGKKYGKERLGLVLGILYSLNPAVFFNSSIWGQFDSIPATMLLGVIYCFNTKRSITAAILFGAAVLTKPQSAVLAPIVLILYFRKVSARKIILTILGGLSAYIFITLPFAANRPILWIIDLYLKSGGDYPYATANGFNFWTLAKGQIVPDNQPFLGWTYAAWSLIFLTLVVIVSFIAILRNIKSAYAIYYTGYFICFAVFMFGTRMHERYLFPALIFLAVCILWNPRLWYSFVVLSLCHLANQWYIYYLSFRKVYWVSANDPIAYAIAVVTMLAMLYAVYEMVLIIKKKTCLS